MSLLPEFLFKEYCWYRYFWLARLTKWALGALWSRSGWVGWMGRFFVSMWIAFLNFHLCCQISWALGNGTAVLVRFIIRKLKITWNVKWGRINLSAGYLVINQWKLFFQWRGGGWERRPLKDEYNSLHWGRMELSRTVFVPEVEAIDAKMQIERNFYFEQSTWPGSLKITTSWYQSFEKCFFSAAVFCRITWNEFCHKLLIQFMPTSKSKTPEKEWKIPVGK